METNMKEVYFDDEKYGCAACKHKETKSDKEPCDECLSTSMREYSHRPLKFEEA